MASSSRTLLRGLRLCRGAASRAVAPARVAPAQLTQAAIDLRHKHLATAWEESVRYSGSGSTCVRDRRDVARDLLPELAGFSRQRLVHVIVTASFAPSSCGTSREVLTAARRTVSDQLPRLRRDPNSLAVILLAYARSAMPVGDLVDAMAGALSGEARIHPRRLCMAFRAATTAMSDGLCDARKLRQFGFSAAAQVAGWPRLRAISSDLRSSGDLAMVSWALVRLLVADADRAVEPVPRALHTFMEGLVSVLCHGSVGPWKASDFELSSLAVLAWSAERCMRACTVSRGRSHGTEDSLSALRPHSLLLATVAEEATQRLADQGGGQEDLDLDSVYRLSLSLSRAAYLPAALEPIVERRLDAWFETLADRVCAGGLGPNPDLDLLSKLPGLLTTYLRRDKHALRSASRPWSSHPAEQQRVASAVGTIIALAVDLSPDLSALSDAQLARLCRAASVTREATPVDGAPWLGALVARARALRPSASLPDVGAVALALAQAPTTDPRLGDSVLSTLWALSASLEHRPPATTAEDCIARFSGVSLVAHALVLRDGLSAPRAPPVGPGPDAAAQALAWAFNSAVDTQLVEEARAALERVRIARVGGRLRRLDKLSARMINSLSRVHRFQLSLHLDGGLGAGTEPGALLHPHVRALAAEAVAVDVPQSGGRGAFLHADVAMIAALAAGERCRVEVETFLDDAGYWVDLFLPLGPDPGPGAGAGGKGLVIEVDGPAHDSHHVDPCTGERTLAWELKKRHLQSAGYTVLSVHHSEWKLLPTTEDKVAFFTNLTGLERTADS